MFISHIAVSMTFMMVFSGLLSLSLHVVHSLHTLVYCFATSSLQLPFENVREFRFYSLVLWKQFHTATLSSKKSELCSVKQIIIFFLVLFSERRVIQFFFFSFFFFLFLSF